MRQETANTAGTNGTWILSAGATVGATDKNAGMGTLTIGASTGTGFTSLRLQRRARAASTETTDNAAYDALIVPSENNLTDEGNNDLFEISLSDAGVIAAGATVQFSIIASDGTDIQTYTGTLLISASNKVGTLTSTITEATANSALSAGTLTTVWSIVDGANKITIRLVPTSSLTPTSFKCYYTVYNNSAQTITQL
jgi:hypothetical protein